MQGELLKDKVCIITGAGKGFGKTIAKKFLECGALLALITRSEEDIKHFKEELGPDNNRILFICGDVSNENTVNNFTEEVIKKFKRIDVLVNNAGMRFRKEFNQTTSDEFKRVLDVNLSSVFYLCKNVIPVMQKQKSGKIINMSSIAGTLGLAELSAYVTSKAAIIGLTKSLAIEFAEDNLQINALAPGFCKTSYFNKFKQNEELYDFTINRTPMKRWGENIEVANACLFLASDLSSYITGDVLNVDGGWSAW